MIDSLANQFMKANDALIIEQNRRKMELSGRFDAEEICKYILSQIEDYQKNLSNDEEIGLKLANFGEASEIHIRNINYKNPNIIEFYGKNLNGDDCKLIQHISQLNFLIISLKPIEIEPYRIGFTID